MLDIRKGIPPTATGTRTRDAQLIIATLAASPNDWHCLGEWSVGAARERARRMRTGHGPYAGATWEATSNTVGPDRCEVWARMVVAVAVAPVVLAAPIEHVFEREASPFTDCPDVADARWIRDADRAWLDPMQFDPLHPEDRAAQVAAIRPRRRVEVPTTDVRTASTRAWHARLERQRLGITAKEQSRRTREDRILAQIG